jgi:hypothetical protein
MSAVRKPPPLEEYASDTDSALDPGIREAVLILRRAGVETIESCEGGSGHAYPEPTIRFQGSHWEGYRAFAVAMEHGLPVLALRYTYPTSNGHLQAPCWEMVFDAGLMSITQAETSAASDTRER